LPRRGPAQHHELAADARISLSEVQRLGYTVYRDDVIDLQRFAKHHPGGDFLKGFVGRDATLAIDNAHGKSPMIRKILARFRVGSFATETRDPVEHDLLALREALHREGQFAYGTGRLVLDVARWLVLFGLGLLVHGWSPALSFALVLAGTVDVVWWIHDAGHDAVFDNERTTRRVIDLLGVLVLGMPQQGYHYGVHRIHHGFPNVVGVDQALETGPLSWDAGSAQKKPACFVHARVVQWFLGIIPAAGPALLASAVGYTVKRKQWLLLGLLAVRWLAVIGLTVRFHAPLHALAPWMAGSILAFMAGLNHFHLPMSHEAPESYTRAVFERTQNIANAGRIWRWLSGGLDLHVEHHLFPTMPSHKYRAVAPRVRALAERHGLPYRTTGRLGAVRALIGALVGPLRKL